MFAVLDGLFGDLDAFCPDSSRRAELETENPGFYLDEERLRQRVGHAYAQLRALQGKALHVATEGEEEEPHKS